MLTTVLVRCRCLGALPDGRRVFGLTSHYTLCLLAKNSYESSWFVRIIASGPQDSVVEYLMPERIAPRPNAYVRGEARSEEQAVQMVLTSMDESEGWQVAREGQKAEPGATDNPDDAQRLR